MEYNTDHFLSMFAKMNISLSDKQLQQFICLLYTSDAADEL